MLKSVRLNGLVTEFYFLPWPSFACGLPNDWVTCCYWFANVAVRGSFSRTGTESITEPALEAYIGFVAGICVAKGFIAPVAYIDAPIWAV